MALIICVRDLWKNPTYYKIEPLETLDNSEDNRIIYNLEFIHEPHSAKELQVQHNIRKRVRWHIDGINFFYLNRELLHFREYRRLLCTHLNLKGVQMLRLQIVQCENDMIDFKWNDMLASLVWQKIETEHLMSWLSTLGGAFSALGEQFSKCAEMAGKISMKQLMIGIRLGDPFLQCRCKLFYSISLIQTGRLRCAKHIIRQQYKFALSHKEEDGRLVKMCQGIWLKLQYEYGRKLKNTLKE